MDRCESRDDCCTPYTTVVWQYVLILMAIVVLFSIVAGATEGQFGVEKTLTGLVLPVGFVWLNISAAMICGWLRRCNRLLLCGLTGIWILASAVTTSPLPDFMFAFLEKPLDGEFKPGVDRPLDIVVVFGGSTQMGPDRPEVSDAGDRLVYAAQLYHRQAAFRILATGHGADVDAVPILNDLGVSIGDVSTIEGRNTFEEISNLRDFLAKQQPKPRIGILSSAYHLPRIKRLAEKAGLKDLIPVSANHRIGAKSYTLLDFIPSLGPLAKFTDAQREFMGRLVGR